MYINIATTIAAVSILTQHSAALELLSQRRLPLVVAMESLESSKSGSSEEQITEPGAFRVTVGLDTPERHQLYDEEDDGLVSPVPQQEPSFYSVQATLVDDKAEEQLRQDLERKEAEMTELREKLAQDSSPQTYRKGIWLVVAVALIATIVVVAISIVVVRSSDSDDDDTTVLPVIEKTRVFNSTDELYDAVDAYLEIVTSIDFFAFGLEDIHNMTFWNVSLLSNFSRVFDAERNVLAAQFDDPSIQYWDMSAATSLRRMFRGWRIETAMNQPLGRWQVGKVHDFGEVFAGSNNFAQDLSSWDVSRATTMDCMFCRASFFNSPLNRWNVSRVTNLNNFLSSGVTFNQPLDQWDVSSVTNFERALYRTVIFNQDLSSWNVSQAANLKAMLGSAEQFDYNLCTWNVRGNVSGMFTGSACPNPEDPVSGVNVCHDCVT